MTITIAQGDARHLDLPDESVDLIVTSPPYWGLRVYSDGGQPIEGQIGAEPTPWQYLEHLWECTREWARVLKPTGSLFVVLGDKYSTYTGANWGNGRSLDGYRGPSKVPHGGPVNAPEVYGVPFKSLMGLPWRYALGCTGGGPAGIDPNVYRQLLRDVADGTRTLAEAEQVIENHTAVPTPGLGLTLRAEILWSKPNGMPESVRDRIRRSHEQVFHFVKDPRGYYAATDAIREPHQMRPQRRPHGRPQDRTPRPGQPRQAWSTARRGEVGVDGHPLGALPGSVWEIAPQPLVIPPRVAHARCCDGDPKPGCEGLRHFAAYPPELARRIITGWSPPAICTRCGQGRRPVTVAVGPAGRHPAGGGTYRVMREPGAKDTNLADAALQPKAIIGWACDCTPYTDHPGTGESTRRRGHNSGEAVNHPQPDAGNHRAGEYERVGPWREYHLDGWTPPPARPAVVADPFGGTGTTAMVADLLGRDGISVDLSADYCDLARWRTTDPGERARALGLPKPPPVPAGQDALFELDGAAT